MKTCFDTYHNYLSGSNGCWKQKHVPYTPSYIKGAQRAHNHYSQSLLRVPQTSLSSLTPSRVFDVPHRTSVYLKLNGVYQYCGYVQWVSPDTITSMQYYPAESGPSFTSDPGDTTLVIQPPDGSTGLYGGNHSSDSNNTENHAPWAWSRAWPPHPHRKGRYTLETRPWRSLELSCVPSAGVIVDEILMSCSKSISFKAVMIRA